MAGSINHHRRSTFSVIFIVCCGLMVLVLVLVAASEASRVEHNSTETFRRVTRDRRRYCGKTLSDTLAMVCNSYPSHGRKKSDPAVSYEDSLEGSYREQLVSEIRQDLDELEELAPVIFDKHPSQYRSFFYYPQMGTHSKNGVIRHTPVDDAMVTFTVESDPIDGGYHRVRRQIVDECCRKSCTLKTLKQYCAD
ncbi:uncharacterized protein LOC129745432 [Uranotaenia lowii]|uniref:uncharacterized protein LOC129745432 n=1 Tax=Uranotaenia lowii TaxID=190385 RepID=UPI002479D4FA|nr:uncharacterized protein LOC129745432 [Uranotaenia lowii]XP_055594482.1 uncharacterized protein LOC129745432 [Uranotaenia lowii]XP_055594484.1 uncharacterized protein LOC129745432 [Uranotaenia lowii]